MLLAGAIPDIVVVDRQTPTLYLQAEGHTRPCALKFLKGISMHRVWYYSSLGNYQVQVSLVPPTLFIWGRGKERVWYLYSTDKLCKHARIIVA